MAPEKIIQRMDELGRVARERMNNTPDNPHLVFAEIMWMTQEEASEMLELRLMLPSAGQERKEARKRIIEKISKRKLDRVIQEV